MPDPWGGTNSDAGGGNNQGQWDTNPSEDNPQNLNKSATGLQASFDNGHQWNVTDLWGGDNKYADYGLGPKNYVAQGDSAGFYDALAKQYAGAHLGQENNAYGAADTAWGQYMQNAQQQQGMLGMMQDAAMGNAPSVAQLQMQQGLQQSTAAQQALGNSARGGPGAWAAAQRNAANQMAQMQQTGVGQQAQLRAGEMANARGAYAQALGQYGAQALQAQNQMGAYGQNFNKQDMASMLALLGYGQTAGQISNQQENAWNNVVSGAASANAQNNANATASTAQITGSVIAAL
jgi:hypothetical protein